VTAKVVTISAVYGARGDVIGSAVAQRLGLPFVDRAIPDTVALEIGCSLEEALAHDGRAESGLGRVLSGAARLPGMAFGGLDVYLPDRTIVPEEEFVDRTEEVIRHMAESGAVILGRAAAVVLADEPYALHVRLDGPAERRLAQVVAELGVEERGARRMLEANDRARTAYVKHFYRVDPASPSLYHLVLDATRLPQAACVDLVVTAADAV
jgi:cytidylate kinase